MKYVGFAIAVLVSCTTATYVTSAQMQTLEVPTTAQMPRISMKDFLAMQRTQQILLIDVRPASAFKAGHVAGAINVPVDTVFDRVPELVMQAGRRTVITYCGCEAERQAAKVAKILFSAGVRDARALQGGYTEWKLATRK